MAEPTEKVRVILPIPKLPKKREGSPELVLSCDKIRFSLGEDIYSEFGWFMREYPRNYRYHMDCAEFRLNSIYKRYAEAHSYLIKELKRKQNENLVGLGLLSNVETVTIYWDFESFLAAFNSALEILARVVGLAYERQLPLSFSKFCKRAPEEGPALLLKKANRLWVSRMKEYRDCFVHYTPIDTILLMHASSYSNGWEIRCKLPINPNIRETLGFRYSRRVELLRYAISTYRHMQSLDKIAGKEILRLFKKGQFPKRREDLFFVGKTRRGRLRG